MPGSVVEAGYWGSLPRVSQFNAVNATQQKLGPDLVFEIPDLSAEGGLRGSMPAKYATQPTKSFSTRQ
jgi:hypothetical protein